MQTSFLAPAAVGHSRRIDPTATLPIAQPWDHEALVDHAVLRMLQSVLDPAEFLSLVRVALQSYGSYAREIGAPGASAEAVHRAAHTLKGSAGSIGCRRIWAIAAEIEAQALGAAGNPSALPALSEAVRATRMELQAHGMV